MTKLRRWLGTRLMSRIRPKMKKLKPKMTKLRRWLRTMLMSRIRPKIKKLKSR